MFTNRKGKLCRQAGGIRLLFMVVVLMMFSACSKKFVVLTGKFDRNSIPPAPDYGNKAHWASLPDKRDAADSVPLSSGLKDHQSTAKADVFFVYPTIYTEMPRSGDQWNADVSDEKLNQQIQTSTILNQASIFNGDCRVFAPYYRQAHLYSFFTKTEDGAKALDLAYQDVRNAFEYYLKNYNQGRPIVIASHSQGSYHCERLLKDYFDGKELSKKLVVAYLVGRAISKDAFQNILPVESPESLGGWASWNTFARDYFPRDYEIRFKGSLSTNPLLWNSTEQFAPKELNHGGVGLHFTYAPEVADAQNHAGLLWINKPYIKGRGLIRTKVWHRADMNLFYFNIRENVTLRIAKYLEEGE